MDLIWISSRHFPQNIFKAPDPQWVLRGNYQELLFQLLPPMFERLGSKDKSFGHQINLKYVYNLVPETQGPVKFTCTSSFFLKGLLSKYHQ